MIDPETARFISHGSRSISSDMSDKHTVLTSHAIVNNFPNFFKLKLSKQITYRMITLAHCWMMTFRLSVVIAGSTREYPERVVRLRQEPITRSLQLPHILVTVFSQTDLFLV